MASLKEEVRNIGEQIKKESELGKIDELLSEMKEKCKNAESSLSKEEKDEIEVCIIGNYVFATHQCGDFYDKWERKEINPTDKQLEEAKKFLNNLKKDTRTFGQKDLPPSFDIEKAGKFLTSLEAKVLAEKTRRKNSPDNNGGNNNNGGDNSENENGNNNSNDTKQKITNLQNQINTLEEKLRKQPNSDSNSEDKEKLARLKAEIEALKRKQKDKPQNENEGTEKNNFPYGLVIGGGVVIFLLLIAVIFFWQRSKRK